MPDIALWLIAWAIIIHTFEEGWLPEHQRLKAEGQTVLWNQAWFLDNLLIFIFVIVLAAIGWRFPIMSGMLPAIGVTHPLLDHLGLSLKTKALRPGSWTGFFLMFPLSLWVYQMHSQQALCSPLELMLSSALGLAISAVSHGVVRDERSLMLLSWIDIS